MTLGALEPFIPSRDLEAAKSFFRDRGFTVIREEAGSLSSASARRAFLLKDLHDEEMTRRCREEPDGVGRGRRPGAWSTRIRRQA
jgi:hypothetical protein